MPHAWALVDSSFPTFSGKENPREQINELVEYMKILTEALQYQLENLDTANWNTTALKTFQTDTTADVAEQLTAVAANLTIVINEVTRIESRLSAVESLSGRVGKVETDMAYIEQAQQEQSDQLEQMQESVDHLQADMDDVQSVVQKEESGATIGQEGQNLHLVGNVYVNGVLIQ